MAKRASLEGPKKHHDDHGMNASVPAHGNAKAVHGEHWERHYQMNHPNTRTPATAFDSKRSDERPCTHIKVNREDH
jgi:hypothetical protein